MGPLPSLGAIRVLRSTLLAGVATILLSVAAPTSAAACVGDAECDDGVTCTLPDTCQLGVCVPGGGGDADGDMLCDADDNCPDFANAGQSDLDGDDEGDACDDDDVDLNVVIARMRRSVNASKPNGAILSKGDFLRLPPEGPITASGGFVVRVKDQVGLDMAFAFTQGECLANDKARIKCKNADNTRQLILQPVSGTNQQDYRYSAKFSKLPLTGPFFMPVRITITNAPATLEEGIDRVGSILDCRQTTLGMTCKE
jgi:hypothetical protein